MTSFYFFDTLTGNLLDDFEVNSASWQDRVNEAETIDVTLKLDDRKNRGKNLRSLATEWKTSIAVEEHGRLYGGPILPHNYSRKDRTLKLKAVGIQGYFDQFPIMPAAGETAPLTLPGDGKPNPALDTHISGWSLGTIGKLLVQQAMSWPGANLPIVLPANVVGAHERNYDFIDMKTVGSALSDLSGVIGGPDMRFELRWKDKTHLQWVLTMGTVEKPRLESETIHYWDLAAEEPSAWDLDVDTDPMDMGDISLATGGRSSDVALVARARNRKLRDAGYPTLFRLDSTHANTSIQATLDGHAAENLRTSHIPAQFWSFTASATQAPLLNEYRVGDLCRLNVENDEYVPTGAHLRRIAALSGNHRGKEITVTLGPVYDG